MEAVFTAAIRFCQQPQPHFRIRDAVVNLSIPPQRTRDLWHGIEDPKISGTTNDSWGLILVKPRLTSALSSCLGVLISTVCAVVLAKLFAGTSWKMEAPLLFAVALVILASRFGAVISVAGSLLAAAIFAYMLYSPEHSLTVASDSERSTLAWMVLVSISISYLLYPTSNGNGRNRGGGGLKG
jgi:uncharacterized protein DUF4118